VSFQIIWRLFFRSYLAYHAENERSTAFVHDESTITAQSRSRFSCILQLFHEMPSLKLYIAPANI
jgi:hypothetical protein